MSNVKKTHQCIYCKDFKSEEEFNREHVISRMLGTYDNAPVLNNFEVCKSCNDYFCNEIENKVSMDSYEGFLRIQHDGKKHKTTRDIGRTRLTVIGQNGLFKNLPLFVSSNPDNPEKIQLETDSVIGIINNSDQQEYDYYHIDELPDCDDKIKTRLKSSKSPLIYFGLDKVDVANALNEKGYEVSTEKFSDELDISDVTDEKTLELRINCKVDVLLERLAAKNIMNYLCYVYGKEFILYKEFDALRDFVRYGKLNSKISICINNGGLLNIDQKVEYGHLIGTAWTAKDGLFLVGFVSWFNSITYSFILMDWSNEKVLLDASNFVCDNTKRTITEFKNPILMDWPGSEHELEFFEGKYLRIVPKSND